MRAVRDPCMEPTTCLREAQMAALRRACVEESPLGQEVMDRLLENAEVACGECVAFCQDTGYEVCFVEAGQEVRFAGADFGEAEVKTYKALGTKAIRKLFVEDFSDLVVTNDPYGGDPCREGRERWRHRPEARQVAP